MNEPETAAEKHLPTKWQQHRFMLMLAAAILIALFLVSVALALYASSGAAQLDLSRPGYVSVRDKANKDDSFDGFSSTGPIDRRALDQFRQLYDKQAEKATNVDSFGGNAMSNQTLGLDAPAE